MQNYSRNITESTFEGRVFADIWEWYPTGKEKDSGTYKLQGFEVEMSNRERIYKTMPDGSKCWYYKDTLHVTEPKLNGMWDQEAIMKFLQSKKK